ncbi:cutinase family protein [Corynebacterium phocae]|uniref:cutinase family protein n=1 Tax=Corynebacterium phocae TaxID=161895 RepID=UPI00095150E0|nr:cutinase family protein [Corynebacterium phocae]
MSSSTVARLVALVCALPFVAPPAQAQAVLPRACHPVHVVQAAGTGFSSSASHDLPAHLLFDLWNPGERLQEKFGANAVGAMNIPYPASLGRVSAFSPTSLGNEGHTYGESVLLGVEAGQRELETVAHWCPDTKFVLIGYSQGAAVAGDLAARVSAGEVSGVAPDNVAAVVVVADPGRSETGAPAPATPPQPTVLYGPVPPGVMAAGGEIINGGGTGVLPGRSGMTGARPGSFHNLRGKVLSLCDSRDMACSTPTGSVIQDVAGYANRVEWTGPVDSTSGQLIAALSNGGVSEEQLRRNGYGLLQLPALIASVEEILGFHAVLTKNGDVATLLGRAIVNALPELAYEGASNKYLVEAATAAEPHVGNWGGVVVEGIRAFAAAESLYWQLFHLHLAPQLTTPEQARQEWVRAVLQHATADFPRDETFEVAGKFGYAHMTYFRHGFYVNGRLGSAYADSWLEEVTAGVLAGQRRETTF